MKREFYFWGIYLERRFGKRTFVFSFGFDWSSILIGLKLSRDCKYGYWSLILLLFPCFPIELACYLEESEWS